MKRTHSARSRGAIPARHEVDVLVAGGGPAGVAAAIAAARAGATVALVESQGCLGGMATSGLVPVFNPFSNGKRPVIRGIGYEILAELRSGSALMKPDPLPREIPKYDWVSLDAEKLKFLLDEMVREAGVKARLFTQVTEPVVKGRRIAAVRSWSKSGEEEWVARVFVDATGDADVAARAGCPFEQGDADGLMQPSTVCFVLAGLTPKAGRFVRTKALIRPVLQKASEEGRLTGRHDHHYCFDHKVPDYTAIGFNYKHQLDTNGTSAASLSQAVMEGRRMAHELCQFLRKNVAGCENAFVTATAQLVGVRETRRIVGEYRMDFDHFASLRKGADDIADYANEIDVHVTGKSKADVAKRAFKEMDTYLPVGQHYGIPYRALIPKGVTNLLVAGRAISCDRKMQGSVRPMPACFATGQAAGLAARLAARGNGKVREVDIRRLQQGLIRQGAFIDL